jgi:predicted permease
MIEQVVRELAQGVRALLRTPILAVVVILSLAVGIGVNTVVFSWLQALVLRPIPGVADASAYYVIEPRSETGTSAGSSWPEYLDLKAQLRALPDLFAHRMVPLNVGEASRTERTYGLLVSGNYFSALGLRPVLGRFIRADEVTRPGAEVVVVISYGYWQTRFAGSPNAIGQTLRANGRDLTVIGVTPDQFQGTVMGVQFDLWVPATLAPSLFAGSRELEDRNLRGYYVMSTLAARTTREAAQAEIDTAMRQLASTFPESNRTIRADLVPYWRASRGPQMFLIQAVAVLQAVMLVLLLAVCGNTANLVLARATARQREIGVRLALGAGTWRIVRLLLVENVALGLGAAALGALFAMWGTQALRAVPLLTTAVPVRFQTSVNESGLVFAILLGVACAVIFGAAPAWHLARVDPQQVLRSGAATPGRRRLRNALMAAEVTLASVVLISAGLFLESFRETRDDPGFQREGLMLAAYDLSGRDINTDAQASDFARRLLDGLRAIPDVEVAALASAVPLDIHGMPQRSFRLEGRARTDGALDRALSNTVTPGYLQAMRIPLVAGRDFVELGDPSAAPQAIVNEEFVRRYVGDGEVLGRRLENNGRTYVISGVAKNALYEAYGEEAAPIIYFSYRDRPSWMGEIHVRARLGEETLLGPAINRVVRDIDASLPVYNVRTMMQHVEMNLAIRRIPARMFVVLGPLLLVLAAVGIYAVVAYTVAHRTTEIGVRIALGATATGVVAQIVRESLRVVVAGAVVGWVIVFMAYIHLVRRPLDIPSFVGVPILLLVVATIASWIPARRATSVDPMVALRRE